MRPLRLAPALSLLAIAMLVAPSVAVGADPVQTLRPIDPLAMETRAVTPDCSTAADDPWTAFTFTPGRMESGDEISAVGAIGYLEAFLARPIAVVCDPARRAAALPGVGIGGTLARVVAPIDSIGTGFRQLAAPQAYDPSDLRVDLRLRKTAVAGGGLRAGDSLQLAPAAAGARFSAWLQAGSGTTPVSFDAWGDGVHGATAAVDAVPGALRLTLRRADGASWEALAPLRPAPVIGATATAKRRSGAMTVTLTGVTTGVAVAGPAEDEGGEAFGAHVAPSGATTMRLKDVPRGKRRFAVAWLDSATRQSAALSCRVRSHGAGRRARCTVQYLFDGLAAGLSRPIAERAGRASSAPGGSARTTQAGQAPHANEAVRTAVAPNAAATLRALAVGDNATPIGDLNGDGTVDFGDVYSKRPLLVSTPAGFVVPPGRYGYGDLRAIGDVDGDGLLDVAVDGRYVIFGTGDWARSTFPYMADGDPPPADRPSMHLEDAGNAFSDSDEHLGLIDLVALPDADGDSKPETAAEYPEGAMILSSRTVQRGADLAPPQFAFPSADGGGTATFLYNLGITDEVLADWAGLHRLVRLAAASKTQASTTFVIRSTDGADRSTQTAQVTVPGSPELAGHDLATGDWLISSVTSGCRYRRSGVCFHRTLRLRADGAPRAQVTARAVSFGDQRAFFGPDGPDADGERDVYLREPSPRRGWPYTRVLPSSAAGSVALSTLGRLSVAGKPVPLDVPAGRWAQPGETATSFIAQELVGRTTRWVDITPAR